jgi:hypothetical protein
MKRYKETSGIEKRKYPSQKRPVFHVIKWSQKHGEPRNRPASIKKWPKDDSLIKKTSTYK